MFTFYIINSDNQELIHDIHCLKHLLYHQSMIKNFVDFIGSYFMIFTLDSIFRMSQTLIIQKIIFVFIMTHCYNNIFIHTLCFFKLTTFTYQKQYIFGFNPTVSSLILQITFFFESSYFDLAK